MLMLMPLTEIQNQVFEALHRFIDQYRYPPTVIELSKAVGKANVGGELVALRKKGWVTKLEDVGMRANIPTSAALNRRDGLALDQGREPWP